MSKFAVSYLDANGASAVSEHDGCDIRVTPNSELVVVHPQDETKATAVYADGRWLCAVRTQA
jgi:hypothetical protein